MRVKALEQWARLVALGDELCFTGQEEPTRKTLHVASLVLWVLPLASRLTLLSANTWRVNMGGLSVRIRSRMALVVLGVTAFLLLAGVVATVAGWDGLTDVAILVLLALGVAIGVDTRLKVGAIRRESQQVRRSQRQ